MRVDIQEHILNPQEMMGEIVCLSEIQEKNVKGKQNFLRDKYRKRAINHCGYYSKIMFLALRLPHM